MSRSDDGVLDIRLATPGSSRIGTNPEQLLAAGWSTCFASALVIVARRRGLELPADSRIEAEVALKHTDGGCCLNVQFRVDLSCIDRDVARLLIEEAHCISPFSRATRGNVEVTTALA